MKLSGWQWLAASSLMLAASASAETRPQYGGTLQVAVREALATLDPAGTLPTDSFARRNLTLLLFETLVTLGDAGNVRPGLATAWQTSPGNQRWQFQLRRGVKFHDGVALTAEIAASSLRVSNSSWKVFAEGDSVIVECDNPDPNLPAELAEAHNAVFRKNSEGKMAGTGPFYLAAAQAGKQLTLNANENYWGGRPFLDSIQVETGRNYHDQLIELELGRADLIEVPVEQARRVATEGRRLSHSAPLELIALLFAREPRSPEEKSLREALALSIDRASIRSVFLQGEGEPAASLLPNWMSGYGFLFPAEANLTRANEERARVHPIPAWTIGYDAGDALSRLLAERIALNARDAGLSLQPIAGTSADIGVVRIPLASTDAWSALAGIAASTGLPAAKLNGDSLEELYLTELATLATQRLIPLFHLPATYAASPALRNWSPGRDGSWRLAEVWLGSAKP